MVPLSNLSTTSPWFPGLLPTLVVIFLRLLVVRLVRPMIGVPICVFSSSCVSIWSSSNIFLFGFFIFRLLLLALHPTSFPLNFSAVSVRTFRTQRYYVEVVVRTILLFLFTY